jgi:hypothetical protein
MLVASTRRWRWTLIARLRRLAMTTGPCLVRIWGQVFGEEDVADAADSAPIHSAQLDRLQVRRRIANSLGATQPLPRSALLPGRGRAPTP